MMVLGDGIKVNFHWKIPELGDIEVLPVYGKSLLASKESLSVQPLIRQPSPTELSTQSDENWALANSDIAFHPADQLEGYIICDLMGKILTLYGERFDDFYSHVGILCLRKVIIDGRPHLIQNLLRFV